MVDALGFSEVPDIRAVLQGHVGKLGFHVRRYYMLCCESPPQVETLGLSRIYGIWVVPVIPYPMNPQTVSIDTSILESFITVKTAHQR